MFQVVHHERGYYTVLKDGVFFASADTPTEAEEEIERGELGIDLE